MLDYTVPVGVSYAIYKYIHARLIHQSFADVFILGGRVNVSLRYVEDGVMTSKGCTKYTLMMIEGITKVIL